MSLKARKNVFYVMVIVAFLAVTIYEFLTPYLSDDIIYMDTVAKANSFFDLFTQEYEHWVGHTGRSVAHMILRVFLFIGVKGVFNVVAGAVFTLLSLLIYLNVDGRKEFDVRVYGFILVMLWFFDPAIANTVFWEDGACNYLFTTTIIMGFITLFRKSIRQQKNSIWLTIGMFILGLLAGWCNENTSGGLILFILIELVYHFVINKKSFSFIRPYIITGLVGSLIGFGLMVSAPGNFGRLSVTEEEHTGVLALVARFLKITLVIKDYYFVLVAAFVSIVIITLFVFGHDKKIFEKMSVMAMFGFLFLATCYALIMIPSSALRSYYGASIFLMTAIAQGISILSMSSEKLLQAALASIVAVFGVFFLLGYIEDGANLARIKREVDERDVYLSELDVEPGANVQAPIIRPQWENRFTVAYENDIQEEWRFWINQVLAEHYGFGTIHGVPRDEWTLY
ncbi:DUF6056 family protein [Butyrivibrio proteoclasticus]|uniref:DUF3329 domain-containing protein n=1 Tax=Butyrivibrio proteoclasticus TaxID=43305 RepID=UPI00047BDF51|nr:DUF6056 family protein [Butyrivibrio proteoclasticus]